MLVPHGSDGACRLVLHCDRPSWLGRQQQIPQTVQRKTRVRDDNVMLGAGLLSGRVIRPPALHCPQGKKAAATTAYARSGGGGACIWCGWGRTIHALWGCVVNLHEPLTFNLWRRNTCEFE